MTGSVRWKPENLPDTFAPSCSLDGLCRFVAILALELLPRPMVFLPELADPGRRHPKSPDDGAGPLSHSQGLGGFSGDGEAGAAS
jgi:hypothetical protein